jgi:hypothetical protein
MVSTVKVLPVAKTLPQAEIAGDNTISIQIITTLFLTLESLSA